MKRIAGSLLAFALLLGTQAFAGDVCEREARWKANGTQRHFIVLAGRTDVFYERSGPTFVMLLKSGAGEAEVGAFGIHAEAGQPAFGAVPAEEYEQFLGEPGYDASRVMLRVEITAPQYERVLRVVRTWDRRVREHALLYPDIALDNVLLVKQATEELNRCGEVLTPYHLDWGLADDVSENNGALRIPLEYFRELKRRNAGRHVPDTDMPLVLLTQAPDHAEPVRTSQRN